MTTFMTNPMVISNVRIVNSYTTGDQLQPRVTVLNDGSYVVVWSSSAQDGSGYGVYHQRFDRLGNMVGSETRVNTYTTSDQNDPSITSLSNGGYVVSWTSTGEDGSGQGVYARRYNADGTAVAAPFRVNVTTTNGQFASEVGAFNSGGFVVAFSHEATVGTDYNIFARSYKPDGTAWGNPIQLNQYTSSLQTNASVVGGANGHSLVVWQSNNQDGSGYGIYGRFVLFTSAASGSEFRINSTTASNQAGPVLTALPNGDYLVVWVSTNQDATTGLGIFGQRVNVNGTLVGGEFQVNTYATGDQNGPSVTNLADGGWLITWQSQGQDGDGLGLYGQRYDSTGNRVGDEFQLHQWVGGDQRNVSVDARADGGWNLVWLNEGADGTFDVHMRIFAPTDAAPTLAATDQIVGVNGRVGATALFDLVDDVASGTRPAGDHPVSSYEFTDNAAGGGYFTVGGVQQASGTPFTVATDLLHTVQWIAAAGVATEQVQIRAFDGVNWSAPVTVTINGTASPDAFAVTGETRANPVHTGGDNDVAVLKDGSYVFVWTSNDEGTTVNGPTTGVYAQRYAADGSKLGGSSGLTPLMKVIRIGPPSPLWRMEAISSPGMATEAGHWLADGSVLMARR